MNLNLFNDFRKSSPTQSSDLSSHVHQHWVHLLHQLQTSQYDHLHGRVIKLVEDLNVNFGKKIILLLFRNLKRLEMNLRVK